MCGGRRLRPDGHGRWSRGGRRFRPALRAGHGPSMSPARWSSVREWFSRRNLGLQPGGSPRPRPRPSAAAARTSMKDLPPPAPQPSPKPIPPVAVVLRPCRGIRVSHTPAPRWPLPPPSIVSARAVSRSIPPARGRAVRRLRRDARWHRRGTMVAPTAMRLRRHQPKPPRKRHGS